MYVFTMSSIRSLLQPSALLALLFGSATIYLIVGAIVNYRKLRQFDGPPVAKFSRVWMFWHECRGRLNRVQVEAQKKYGM